MTDSARDLFGGLLDAWDGLGNDLRGSIRSDAPHFVSWLERVKQAADSDSTPPLPDREEIAEAEVYRIANIIGDQMEATLEVDRVTGDINGLIHARYAAARAILALREPGEGVATRSFECMGRKQVLPEPGECSWPDCGCDTHATKVIESLVEQGWSAPALPAAGPDLTAATSPPAQAAGNPVPPLGEGGLAGTFARYAKHFAGWPGTVEVTLALAEIEQICDALAATPTNRDALVEAANTLADPCDTSDFDGDEAAALRQTINDALRTIKSALSQEAPDAGAALLPDPAEAGTTDGERK